MSPSLLLPFGVCLLPSVLVVLVIWLTPLRGWARRRPPARWATLLAGGPVAWGLSVETIMALWTTILYGIAEFYFDTMLGTVPGVSRAKIGAYRLAVQVEVWARQYLPWNPPGRVCFHADPTVCRLADEVLKGSPAHDLGPLFLFGALALPAAALVMGIGWWITRPQAKTPAPPASESPGQ